MQHRDLTLKNILIQQKDRDESSPATLLLKSAWSPSRSPLTATLKFQYYLTVIDFGASRYYGEEINRVDAGNQGYSDLHTLCETFYLHIYGRFYRDAVGAPLLSEEQDHIVDVVSIENPIPKTRQSLQHVLMLCIQQNSDKTYALTKQTVVKVELLVSGVSQA